MKLCVSTKKCVQPLPELDWVSGLAFPDLEQAPAQRLELCAHDGIAFLISPQLGQPIFRSRLRQPRQAAAAVLMPEASLHEDRLAQPGQHKVWRARKIATMEPESKAERVDHSPDHFLWHCVALADSPHVGAASLGRKTIRHEPRLAC